MSKTVLAILCISSLFAATAHAGIVFGTITEGGRGAANLNIEIKCGQSGPFRASTNNQGSYSVRVNATGECSLKITNKPGGPATSIFSYAQPVRYDFNLNRSSSNVYTLN